MSECTKRNASRTAVLAGSTLLFLMFFAGVMFLCSGGAGSSSSELRFGTERNSAGFVFADLDGDRIPDMALVELQTGRSTRTNYAVRVKLSAGTESAIGVRGPVGGLRVAARDVNGDDKVDLILTATLDDGFVQVLLNDGHGNFTVVPAGNFSRVEGRGENEVSGPSGPIADRTTLLSRRAPLGDGLVGASKSGAMAVEHSFRRSSGWAVARLAVGPRTGRSPPLRIVLS